VLLLLLALAADRQHAVLERHVHVLAAHAGQFSLDEVFLLGLAGVGDRRPLGAGASIVSAQAQPARDLRRKEAADEVLGLGEGFAANDVHGDSPAGSCEKKGMPEQGTSTSKGGNK